MHPTRLAAAASVAAVAAAGAYAIGSQQSGGSALAAGASRATPATQVPAVSPAVRTGLRGPGRDLASAADALGVSESSLRTALAELRAEQDPKAGRADLAAALATALGKTQAQVTAALDAVRSDGGRRRGRGDGLATALAARLGVSAERVRAALTEAHEAAHAARRQEVAAALAKELGIDTARVADALEAVRPDPGDRSARRDGIDLTEALAGELGIAEERVDEALDALRDARRAEHERRLQAFADRLAAKLEISRERVRELVADGGLLGGPGRGGHGGGPGFPGGGRP